MVSDVLFKTSNIITNCIWKEWVNEWLLFNANSAIFSAISWREQDNFRWDDEVRFVLNQHAYIKKKTNDTMVERYCTALRLNVMLTRWNKPKDTQRTFCRFTSNHHTRMDYNYQLSSMQRHSKNWIKCTNKAINSERYWGYWLYYSGSVTLSTVISLAFVICDYNSVYIKSKIFVFMIEQNITTIYQLQTI